MGSGQWLKRIAKIKGFIEQMNERLNHIEDRLNHFESRLDHLDSRLDHLEGRMTQLLYAMIAMWMTIILTILFK